MLWPQESAPTTTSVPAYYAHVTDTTIVVGPPLGSAAGTATVEVVGTITPDALSVSNTTTYLSTNYPDLLLAASMIFISGYQRNFGAQADNPQQAQSWTAQYMTLLESAKRSETMKSGLPQTV
jgi:hypothetical protein